MDDPLHVGPRRRPEQQGVDDRKHRRVGADAYCQQGDGSEREDGRPHEVAEGVAQVGRDGSHAVLVVVGVEGPSCRTSSPNGPRRHRDVVDGPHPDAPPPARVTRAFESGFDEGEHLFGVLIAEPAREGVEQEREESTHQVVRGRTFLSRATSTMLAIRRASPPTSSRPLSVIR